VRALGHVRIATPIAAALLLLMLVRAIGFGFSFLATRESLVVRAPDSLQQLQHNLRPLRQHIEGQTPLFAREPERTT
jgi:hypothetical protein